MAAAPEVRIESRDDVLRLVLNRPRKGNALTPEMMGALTAAFAGAAEHVGLRAVTLVGEGKQFCTGADLGWMASPPTVEQGEALAELFRTIAECPLPTLALVKGGCYGGAMGLVAACDFVLAAPGAEFGFTEVRVGLAPAVISPWAMQRLGVARTRELFLTGERFDTARALELGLLTSVADDLEAAAGELLDALRAGGPQAQRAIKELLLGRDETSDERDARLARAITALRDSDEAREGVAAFLEKRKPEW
jgi:methylglutaconyl-CoA hydratase